MRIQFFFGLLSCINYILSEETASPRIVIVGAGAAGIAAGTRLLQNGLNNVTILEAEDRIGGRIHTINMREYLVDMGAQWVVGQNHNVVYDMAWPLGLLEKYEDSGFVYTSKLFFSSGEEISAETSTILVLYQMFTVDTIPDDLSNLKTGSLGEFLESKHSKFFKKLTEIKPEQQEPLLYFLNLCEMGFQAADNWYQVSAKRMRDSPRREEDEGFNWKNLTYAMILEILMKDYPNPEEAIPLRDHIITGDKVTKINYDMSNESKTVVTKDGKEYLADHVIFTGSLGVLKADHEKMFDPPLPESKINTITNLQIGHVAKIYLYYENPWWTNDIYLRGIVWTEADRKEILENNPETKWMLGIFMLNPIEHKPKVLCFWLSGPYVKDMELIPEDVLLNQTKTFLNKFFGHTNNLTEPSMLTRTRWYTNENFRGTYSYPSLTAEKANVNGEDLAEPIMKDNKPCLQFAGEATAKYYGTVNGAVSSGWREADRLINLYFSKE